MLALEGVKGLVSDIDGSMSKDRIARAQGYGILKKELCDGHFATAIGGFKDALRIELLVRRDKQYFNGDGSGAEIEGMQMMYQSLTKRNLVTRAEMEWFARRHIERNIIPSTRQLVVEFSSERRGPTVLVTAGGSTGAWVCAQYLGVIDYAANLDIYDQHGMLKGIEVRIDNGERKRDAAKRVLEKHGLDIAECGAVGNNKTDLPMLKASKLSISSPFATDEVLANTEVHLLRGNLRG